MPLRQVRECAVFPRKEAKDYIVRLLGPPFPEGGAREVLQDWPVDLCPRALDRLKKKIEQGVTPPVTRKKGGSDAE